MIVRKVLHIFASFVVLALLQAGTCCTSKPGLEPQTRGVCNIKISSQASVPLVYEYWRNQQSGEGQLKIYPNMDGHGLEPFVCEIEPGQEFLTAAYPEHFGKDLDLFVTRWDLGAVSEGLRVYGPTGRGRIGCLFEGACRFGFIIVDVSGDGYKDIVACEGDIGPSKKTMTVYSWDGLRFTPRETFSVLVPHFYNVRSTLPDER